MQKVQQANIQSVTVPVELSVKYSIHSFAVLIHSNIKTMEEEREDTEATRSNLSFTVSAVLPDMIEVLQWRL